MNIANLEVTKGLVAKSDTKSPQLIQVSATTTDVNSGIVDLEWYNVADDGTINEPFATANIYYGDSREWLESWKPIKHLVEGRIESLERMAEAGTANRFSHSMAYTLFANNLVDYADKYRGMQAVVMNEFEAAADVTLTTEKGGMWTVPPYFIDSCAHLAGFIMNVSDSSDTANTFCVTPGWKTMRFAKPLVAGGKYKSYVKMIPTEDDPSVYLGDVYVMEEGEVMGMVGGIKFRRYPRMLLGKFFSPPDKASQNAESQPTAPARPKPAPTKAPAKEDAPGPVPPPTPPESEPTQPSTPTEESSSPAGSTPPTTAPSTTADPDSTTTKAMQIIAGEAGMDFDDLDDNMYFANIGVDSLMSLVISEKFRQSLGIQVASSLFLEYPSIGALRAWLEEYYS
jgi:monodictyphenone polyketide synthase